jgi:tRNA(fMet)-specific endonuclease VapC
MLVGVHRSDAEHVEQERAFVEALLGTVPVLAFNLDCARHRARIDAELQAAGQQVALPDLAIAATALAYALPLVTLNRRHAARVPDLELIGP